MTLSDAIRRDKEEGADGLWGMFGMYVDMDLSNDPHVSANARRGARLPHLEDAILAAEEMAEAVGLLFDQVSDGDGYTEATAMKLNTALLTYRAAVKKMEG